VLGGVHQHECHRQRVNHQQRAPPPSDASPQEHRDHRGHRGVQRRDRRDQVDAGLSGVEQRARRLQVQRSPSAGRDPLHELVGAGPAGVHRSQQPAAGNPGGPAEHARRVGRAARDVGRCATRGCPRRRGRQQHIHDEGRERQRDEPAHEGRPFGPVAQPEHSGYRVRQDEERHVDTADDHFPPGRLRHLEVLLQPHRRDGAEKQPAVRARLELPEGRRAEHVGRTPAEVVERQDQCEGQPVAHDGEHPVPAPDAGGDQARGDIEQQQFAVECQPGRDGAVDHHSGPRGDGETPRPGESIRAAGRVRCGSRRGGVRRPAGASEPSRPGRWIGLQGSNPAIGRYRH
jgi:hypothetical protein